MVQADKFFERGEKTLDLNSILAYIFGLIVLFLTGWLLIVPLKLLWRLIYNSLIGALLLIVLNFFGSPFGIAIGINPITAAVCGFLGLPGVLFLLLAKFLLQI